MDTAKAFIRDFGIELTALLTPPNHLWVGSGRTTVQPLANTACGVGDMVSPPFATSGFRAVCGFSIEGATEIRDTGHLGKGDVGILYSGGMWYPNEVVRKGTYHHLKDGRLLSFGISSSLSPSCRGAGFVLEVGLTNRSGRRVRLAFRPELAVERIIVLPLQRWGFSQPRGGEPAVPRPGGREWTTSEARLVADWDEAPAELEPDGALRRFLTVEVTGRSASARRADPEGIARETREAWDRRIARAFGALPRLESDIPGLEAYYRRSVLSGLVCEWDNPEFGVRPLYATSGMDGGAVCSYVWDLGGYAAFIASLAFGDDLLPTIRAMATVGMDRYYAVSAAGTGVGVRYAYSVWAFVNLVWAMALLRGPSRELYEAARRLTLENESLEDPDTGLIDYGTQENLLEMRGAGWEHVTPSPNAERATCLRRIAALGDYFGEPEAAGWRARADRILEAVRRALWNEEEGWFHCLYPDGRREVVYSIQAFDALRAGAATDAMRRAMLDRLVSRGFLGAYGVSSVASSDEAHYEVNDPDWSGSGSYSGEGPQLAQTLFELGETTLAWEVLARHFWMGRHLAYYPQEHYVDRPALPAHKRANVIAGMCGAEAVVFSAFGVELSLDGSAWMEPAPPPSGFVALEGLVLRGRSIDAHLSAGRFRVRADGRQIHDGPPGRVKLTGP